MKRLNGNVGWEDLKKSLPETDDAGYYDDLQIEAKPRKKAQEQKHSVEDERFSKNYDNAVDVNLLDFVESVHSMKDEKMIIAECVPDTTAKNTNY